jgi:hypothetical protein
MTKADLDALIDAGDVDACIAAFEGMSESERTKLGSAAVARLRALAKAIPAELADAHLHPSVPIDRARLASYRAARVAILATATFSRWKSVKSLALPPDEQSFRVVANRRPDWLNELVEHLCDQDELTGSRWPVIRRFVREGYCGPPRNPRYIDRMLRALPQQAEWAKPRWKVLPGNRKKRKCVQVGVSLKDVLLADPGLLEHEIWRIFEVEPGTGAVQLFAGSARDNGRDLSWDGALADLARDGTISRDRLLGATLDGLSRDMNETRARWFARLHNRLEPTLEERAGQTERYVDLLGSRNNSTVGFALGVIKDLVKAASVDPISIIDRLARAMHSHTKGTVKEALKVLEFAARRTSDPALRARVLAVATEGLVHDASDIHSAILDFTERHGDRQDQSLHSLLMARRDGFAVSLRSRLDAWLGVPSEPESEPVHDEQDLADLASRAAMLDPRLAALAGVAEALAVVRGERADSPALSFDGTEIPRLDPAQRLEPINDVDTLIELCLRLIEDARPSEDIDRCVDAISRLCHQRPADFEKRTAPLAARIRQLLSPPSAGLSPYLFGAVVRSWLSGEGPEPRPFDGYFRALEHFTSAWAGALASRAAKARAAPLLAAPTHAGGWIDPRTFVERFRLRSQMSLADEPQDLILAILRLAPDHRAAALADARDLPGEQGAAIRYALGGDGETIGPSAGLWVAAARARSPWSDDPAVETRHPGLGPDAGRAAAYRVGGNQTIRRGVGSAQLRIAREPAIRERERDLAELPTVSYHAVRWLRSDDWPSPASLWPLARESFCAFGAQQLVKSSEASSDYQGSRQCLLPLLDADCPLRPMARLLLSLALNVKSPEVAGLATDTVVAAIDDGRLDGDTLGESLRIVWQLRVETDSPGPNIAANKTRTHHVPFVKSSRWAKALDDIARSSLVHSRAIARAIEIFVADEASFSRPAASVVPFLEILRETSVETGRAVSAEARAFLSRIGTTGKTGRIVNDLMALCDLPDSPALRAARIQALVRRIERAERWMAWERADDD